MIRRKSRKMHKEKKRNCCGGKIRKKKKKKSSLLKNVQNFCSCASFTDTRISIYDGPEPIAQLCQAGNQQNGKSKARESEASWNINT